MTTGRFTALALALFGCTEPAIPGSFDEDTDGDGLMDDLEYVLGTNPTIGDSDGDSYTDYDEWFEGTDPTDAKDRIYQGRWPYWRDKDLLPPPRPERGLGIDERVPRLVLPDHNGEWVDLYDFAGPDQRYDYILVDVCAAWCGPCRSLAEWISGGADHYTLDADFADVRQAVDEGRLAYLTILTQDNAGAIPEVDFLAEYHGDYDHRRIPILSDVDGYVEEQVVGMTGAWPSSMLIRAKNMKLLAIDTMIPGGLEDAQAVLDSGD